MWQFSQWLLNNDCHDVNVVIANPKWVKAVKGNKDDTKDSKWIGDLFRPGLVRGSYVPCKKIRILREYTRYRYKLVSCRSSEKNRYQNALTVCNVALDSVVSDIFGKSSTSIIDYLPEQSGTSIDHEEIASKLLRSLKSKEDAVQFLCTIPGVKRDSAITIISEIGTDMSQFSSSKRLCCRAGLTPGSNESAGKKKSVRITRAGVCLKPALVQCAHAAVKSDKSPYYKKLPALDSSFKCVHLCFSSTFFHTTLPGNSLIRTPRPFQNIPNMLVILYNSNYFHIHYTSYLSYIFVFIKEHTSHKKYHKEQDNPPLMYYPISLISLFPG